jgi:hypothetical protein
MEIWQMTKAQYEAKFGKGVKNTTVTGGFSAHKAIDKKLGWGGY